MSLDKFKRKLARKGQTITLQERSIQPPTFGNTDFDVWYTDNVDVQALFCTETGRTYFDGVSTESPITHGFKIEYIEGLTAETWILFKGRRIDILHVENCCEQDEILKLTCTDKGLASKSGASGSLPDKPTQGDIGLSITSP